MLFAESLRSSIFKCLVRKISVVIIDHLKYKTQNVTLHCSEDSSIPTSVKMPCDLLFEVIRAQENGRWAVSKTMFKVAQMKK